MFLMDKSGGGTRWDQNPGGLHVPVGHGHVVRLAVDNSLHVAVLFTSNGSGSSSNSIDSNVSCANRGLCSTALWLKKILTLCYGSCDQAFKGNEPLIPVDPQRSWFQQPA